MTIRSALENLCDAPRICDAVIGLFETELRFPVQRVADLPVPVGNLLKDNYRESFKDLIDRVYFPGLISEEAFDGVERWKPADALTDASWDDYQGMALFSVELYERKDGRPPTRSALADLTRAFNRSFFHHPVIILFRYRLRGGDGVPGHL